MSRSRQCNPLPPSRSEVARAVRSAIRRGPGGDPIEPPALPREILSTTETGDGFRFTTFRVEGTIYCCVERDGQEAVVQFTPEPDQAPSSIPQEILELTAQTLWEAMDDLTRSVQP